MASQKKNVLNTTLDRGFALSQEQYDLILNFLKNGVTPTMHDIKAANMHGGGVGLDASRKMGTFSRFKSVAKRLRYRAKDNALVFYCNSKIVLPNTRFVETIKKAHQSKGQKHLNFTKTLEKLMEKYSIGYRQFGIREEMVREVVRACHEGSCAKYHRQAPGKLPAAANIHEAFMKNTTAALDLTTTVPRPIAPTVASYPSQPLQHLYVHSRPGHNYIAIPCMFGIPVSMARGPVPIKPLLVYTGSCSAQNTGTSTSVTMVSKSGHLPTESSQAENVNRFMLMPTPTSAVPNLVKLLTMNPVKPQGPMASTMTTSANASMLNQSLYAATCNPAYSSTGCSRSLTDISETVGTINLQSNTMAVDANNNQIQPHESKKIVIEPPVDDGLCHSDRQDLVSAIYGHVLQSHDGGGGSCREEDLHGPGFTEISNESCTRPLLEAVNFPHIWHNLADLTEEREPFRRIGNGIKDMRPDLLQALVGGSQATDHLRKKIASIEHMISSLKEYTKDFDTSSDEGEKSFATE